MMSKKAKRHNAPRNITQSRDLERWLERAGQLLVVADYPGVIAIAQRVLRAPIASPQQRSEAYERLGAAHMLLQQHEESYAMVTAALALTPNDPLLWYNRGMASRYTARLGQSVRDFERAEALDVDGLLVGKLADVLPFARSIAESERALRGPQFTLDDLIVQETVFQHAVRAMQQQRWAEAEPFFRQSIAMGDVLPQPQGNLGLCLMMQRRFDEAEVALRRVLEIEPNYTIALQNLVGLPEIKASGKLPEIRMKPAFEGHQPNMSLTFVKEGDKP